MDVHVVSKSDNRQHATVRVPPPSHQLKASSLRLRASILTLSSNNLSYALGGTWLRWWDTYPVPTTAPPPYNDPTEWGIVPTWGFAEVLESTIPEIESGATLHGFWPTSQHHFDLELAADEVPGRWKEVSGHRSALMPLYNRYSVVDTTTEAHDRETLGWRAGMILIAGYLLAQYVFTPDPKTNPPIHPFGGTEGWTAEDADLSKSVFVSLAASTKTARSLAYYLYCRPAGTGPLGFLQVTSSPGPIAEAAGKFLPQFPVKTVDYGDVANVEEWLSGLGAERIVIADSGARDGALDQLRGVIDGGPGLKGTKVVIIQIGNQQKIYSADEARAAAASVEALGKVRYNTSAVQETAIQLQGTGAYYDKLTKHLKEWLQHRESAAPDLKLVWGKGIAGAEGIEGGWDALGQSKVKPEEVLVYQL
ncbi:DUF2855 family protein [Aspergillus lucknowensis]|uniref:Uncharacterized protein n=1 Tax=Aspergillus lucknowensis TaxID=176173 RepID=A0ABR4LT43_9EURO